jgi:hypothetical protein
MQPIATAVRVLPEYRLALTFNDGVRGVVDFAPLLYERDDGVFAQLRDPERFAEVYINPEWGHLEWPNGADIDPYVLYARATGSPIE